MYSPLPAIILDANGVLLHVNCAAREFFDQDVVGCRGKDSETFFKRIFSDCDHTTLSILCHLRRREADDVRSTTTVQPCEFNVTECELRYCTSRFGVADLFIASAPFIETESGDIIGYLVSFVPTTFLRRQDFLESLKRLWTHESTWDIYAISYDRVQLELSFYNEAVKRHLTAMTDASISAVLDVGAGTGNVTVPLLERGVYVTAVDIGRSMIRRLLDKIPELCRHRLRVIEDTAERLPEIADASMDGVTAMLSFFDMRDPVSALRESQRVLRPGGKMIVTEPKECFNVDCLLQSAKAELNCRGVMTRLAEDWRRIESVASAINQSVMQTKQAACSSGGRAQAYWSAERVFDILRKDGYEELSIIDSHHGNCATITGVKPVFRSPFVL